MNKHNLWPPDSYSFLEYISVFYKGFEKNEDSFNYAYCVLWMG